MLDSSGYIFGGSVENNTTGDADNLLVKFDNNGDIIFVKKYASTDFEALYGDALTQDDHILLVGLKGPYSAPKDVLLMKTDPNGNLIWQKQYGGAETDWGYSIFENELFKYVIGAIKIYNGINANPWIIITDSCQTEIGSGKISNDEIAVINLFNLPPPLPHALLQLYVVLYSGDRLTLKNVRSGFL
ncbi:MAG: hypothetical protein H0V65_00180 [Chitinophagales bacterium]|nr:hypothetical protein [Chitinophagales bacterium]